MKQVSETAKGIFCIITSAFCFALMAVFVRLSGDIHFVQKAFFRNAVAFFIAVFSALRLAKFNIDERQTSSFIGLPTPANALFWGSLIVGSGEFILMHINVLIIIALIFLFSWLLVAEIPMFALKIKDLSWQNNKIRYFFILVSIPLLIVFKLSGIAAVIAWYILLSLVTQNKKA